MRSPMPRAGQLAGPRRCRARCRMRCGGCARASASGSTTAASAASSSKRRADARRGPRSPTRATGGERLRADKGINLPGHATRPAGADAPRTCEDLEVVAQHADLVGLSFAQSAADVRALRQRLAALGAPQPGAGAQDRDPTRLRAPAGDAAGGHGAARRPA